MFGQEPLAYPSRGPFNPGVPNRQLWAIGMVVVQWGMAESIREQSVFSLVEDDASLAAEYKNLRNSSSRTAFWKRHVEAKSQDPELTQNLDFIVRFQRLNDVRDNIVHRMWGGGIEEGSDGVPADLGTHDAAMHRRRDEKKKTKTKDGRRNISWHLDFQGLRKTAFDIAQLNRDILASWLPPGSNGQFNIWSALDEEGKLQVGIASADESQPVPLPEK